MTHCTPEELGADILSGVTTNLVKQLDLALQARIPSKMREWQWSGSEMGGDIGSLFKFSPGWEGVKAEGMLR